MRIPLAKPYLHDEDVATGVIWSREILESGRLINGDYTRRFEIETAANVGVQHGIAVNSCTTALQIIMEYIGVKDKKVLVPVNTFIATANAVLFAGGIPVLTDIGEDLQMDLKEIQRLADGDTKAVIVVHIGGTVHPEIAEIARFCREKGIFLIEDCAHAHGSSLNGIAAGAFGFAGAFSYYASKTITTGVGGMIVTSDDTLAEHARIVRFHGEASRGIQTRRGNDWLMTEFQAATGLLQLRRIDDIVARRAAIAERYTEALSDLPLRFFPPENGSVSGYYKFFIRFRTAHELERVKLALEQRGIKTGYSYWPPVHLQPVNIDAGDYAEGDFPVAEKVLKEVMSLPMYTGMRGDELQDVIEAVTTAVGDSEVSPHSIMRQAQPYSA